MILLRPADRTSILIHSAKGSTWDDHKYIKKVDGVYYYPNDYEGGRHIGDAKTGAISKEERYEKDSGMDEAEEAWESTVYGDIDRIMKENPNLTDPIALAKLAFDNNLKGKMSDAEISRMMEKVKAHYSKSTEDKVEGSKTYSKKSSQTSKSTEKSKIASEAAKESGSSLKKMGDAAASAIAKSKDKTYEVYDKKKKKEIKHALDFVQGIVLEYGR